MKLDKFEGALEAQELRKYLYWLSLYLSYYIKRFAYAIWHLFNSTQNILALHRLLN